MKTNSPQNQMGPFLLKIFANNFYVVTKKRLREVSAAAIISRDLQIF